MTTTSTRAPLGWLVPDTVPPRLRDVQGCEIERDRLRTRVTVATPGGPRHALLLRQFALVEELIERTRLAAADRRVVERQRQDLRQAQAKAAGARGDLPTVVKTRERAEAEIRRLRHRVADATIRPGPSGSAGGALHVALTEHATLVRRFEELMTAVEGAEAELARVRHDNAVDTLLTSVAAPFAAIALRAGVPDEMRATMLAAYDLPVMVFDPRRCLCAPDSAPGTPLAFSPLEAVKRLAQCVASPDSSVLRVDASELLDHAPA